MGLKAAPYVANNISNVANAIDNALPFSKFGDMTTQLRYIAAYTNGKQAFEYQ